MGILLTRWEGEFEGCAIAVHRDELTKGFSLEWNGVKIAARKWSWIGLGELQGTAEIGGQPVAVRAALSWGGLRQLQGKCTVTVRGHEVPLRLVK